LCPVDIARQASPAVSFPLGHEHPSSQPGMLWISMWRDLGRPRNYDNKFIR
jgi:hypothetical protein